MKILFLMTYQMKENFVKINIMLSKRYVKPTWKSFMLNKDGVAILLQTGGQGHPTPSLTPTTPPTPLQHTHTQTIPTAAS